MIKSPSQDQKLPAYLRNLSLSAGKEEQDIRSSPGSLGAIISILDLLSTVLTQVNSEMMRVSVLTYSVWAFGVLPSHTSALNVKKAALLAVQGLLFQSTDLDTGTAQRALQLWRLGNLRVSRFL